MAESFDHIVENLCQNADDAIALVVRIAIVEFLEVIEIRLARPELTSRTIGADLRLDLDRPGAGSTDARTNRGPSAAASSRRIVTSDSSRRSRITSSAPARNPASNDVGSSEEITTAGTTPVYESLFKRLSAARTSSPRERLSKITTRGRLRSALPIRVSSS
jgi:hypothetical protein